jgi:hypothetical protein
MSRVAAAAIVAVVGVFAAVYFFARDPAEPVAASVPAPAVTESPAAIPPAPAAVGEVPAVRPVATDPRLAALMGSPGDDRVELIPGPDGRVIREMDVDPNSAGYRKPLREYAYAGDKVVAITVYKYFGDQTQVIRVAVSYKSDGSVEHYREDTRYVRSDQAKSN